MQLYQTRQFQLIVNFEYFLYIDVNLMFDFRGGLLFRPTQCLRVKKQVVNYFNQEYWFMRKK